MAQVAIVATDPKTGVQRKHIWPPKIAEVVELCDERIAYIAKMERFKNWGNQDAVLMLEGPREKTRHSMNCTRNECNHQRPAWDIVLGRKLVTHSDRYQSSCAPDPTMPESETSSDTTLSASFPPGAQKCLADPASPLSPMPPPPIRVDRHQFRDAVRYPVKLMTITIEKRRSLSK